VKTRRSVLVLCCALLTSAPVRGQLLLDSLDRALSGIATKFQLAGMSVAVVRDTQIVFAEGYGLADIGRSIAMTDSSVYRIASISKSISATALMKIYEERAKTDSAFRLEEDVSRYLGFTLRNSSYPNDSITFRMLLSHTAGLRDGSGYDSFLSASYSSTPPPVLSSLLVPGGSYYTANMWSSTYRPGAYFQYANINYGVIGTLVERLSGVRFDVYCRTRILQPLGLVGSFNIQDLPNMNNVAVLYRKPGGVWTPQADNYGGVKPAPRDLSSYVVGTNGLLFAPQGGLRISATELARFMMMHMRNGAMSGVRILPESIVTAMRTPIWTYTPGNGNNYYGIFNTYGIGLSRTTELLPGQTIVGHPGEAYGLISDMYFATDGAYGIVFITNGSATSWQAGSYSGWYKIEEEVYKACHDLAVVPPLTSAESVPTGIPDRTELLQNYPNPFNPLTNVDFRLTIGGPVKVNVVDLLGREVSVLVNQVLAPGVYHFRWDASAFPSGVYFYRLKAGSFTQTKRMVLLK